MRSIRGRWLDPAADPCGVDEQPRLAGDGDDLVNRVHSGTGDAVHHSARWLPASLFNSDDLPMFGRPTMATGAGR